MAKLQLKAVTGLLSSWLCAYVLVTVLRCHPTSEGTATCSSAGELHVGSVPQLVHQPECWPPGPGLHFKDNFLPFLAMV